jgi:hypothetical protein
VETNYSKSFQDISIKKGLHKLTINSDYGNINLLKSINLNQSSNEKHFNL